MPRLIAALVVACVVVSSASAQIVYEPVRYQYGGQIPYYYGGSDPDMFRYADREYVSVHNGFASAHGDVMVHHEDSQIRPHVYIDQLPHANAAVYNYNADDARNDAYANAARYFRKRDIIAQGVIDETGALHVPPQASSEHMGTIEIKPYVHPTATPKPVLVIPKDLLDRKLTPENKVVASAE